MRDTSVLSTAVIFPNSWALDGHLWPINTYTTENTNMIFDYRSALMLPIEASFLFIFISFMVSYAEFIVSVDSGL